MSKYKDRRPTNVGKLALQAALGASLTLAQLLLLPVGVATEYLFTRTKDEKENTRRSRLATDYWDSLKN
ncbi:MAG: hypothetical protein JO253_07010 [Alphaproteobacteria bacterium]|nr:hypothetical protein [Alphaproteobacteria bacterium]